MPTAVADKADRGRDLLFGVIALQMNFVNQAQFVEVMTLLPSQPDKGAEDLFGEKAYLKAFQVMALKGLIDAQLKMHGGDIAKSIAAFEGNAAVERSMVLIGEKSPGKVPVVTAHETTTQTIVLARTEQDRYVLGRELGRGGLGLVVLALDRDLMGREVAMKLLLPPPEGGAGVRPPGVSPSPGTPPARERFLEEAQITAQLQHPNIVAVYELGTRKGGEPYYTMPVATGRTLKEEIHATHARLASGEIAPGAWGVERLRLLSTYQGMCHGLSYAHSRGVVHRDIKPANVMVGEHGETIVLDWGLAKVTRRAGDGGKGGTEKTRSDRELEKYIRTLREQKGFQTLEGTVTGTPAYMSPEQAAGRIQDIDERSDIWSLGAVLFEILTGRPPFDGRSAYEVLFKVMAGAAPDPREVSSQALVPEDLAAVCQKAMNKERAARYGSVKELLEDLTLSIEGGKERERNHLRCEEKLESARRLVREYHELSEVIIARRAALAKTRAAIKTWEPISTPGGDKTKLLALEHELEEARWLAGSAFNAALVALAEALVFEPDNREARRELAEFHYFHMVKAERERDLKELEFHKAQVALYNDGDFDERLRGDGTVTIASDPPGAEALLYGYVEEKWFLKPAGERSLGATPLPKMALPMGSYLLVLKKDGYRDTRVPFVVSRLEDVALNVKLYTDALIGEGFVYVPGGKFIMGERDETREVRVGDFFIGRFPVTFAEYCDWLDWLDANKPDEVKKRAPQDKENGLLVRKAEDGRYIPFDPSPAPGGSELLNMSLPVFSVSWHNAVAYIAWRSERDGRRYAFPTEAEREKAARGADGRTYPWGNRFDATLCKMAESTEAATQPEPVGAYSTDESPYGVRDVAGGVMDWCEDWYDERKVWKVVKGGNWGYASSGHCRSAYRVRVDPGFTGALNGFRLAVRPGAAEGSGS